MVPVLLAPIPDNVRGVVRHGVFYADDEPMDVPAVQEQRIVHYAGDGWGCGMDWCISQTDVYEPYWTCADKFRVLLTSEDGAHHCVRFPQNN